MHLQFHHKNLNASLHKIYFILSLRVINHTSQQWSLSADPGGNPKYWHVGGPPTLKLKN